MAWGRWSGVAVVTRTAGHDRLTLHSDSVVRVFSEVIFLIFLLSQKRKVRPPPVLERSGFSRALLHARAASFDLMVALMRLGGGAPARSQQVMPAAMRTPMRLPAS